MDLAQKLAISRGLRGSTIDTTVLRELVIEAHEDARKVYLAAAPQTVHVGYEQALLKLSEPSRRVRYHRPTCRHFGVPTAARVEVALETTEYQGYEQCTYCGDLSITEWATHVGLDPSQVSAIVRKSVNRIRKATAVKIFRAIGEEPHPSLLDGVSE